jgi:signal transduction histidine kinase
MLVALGVAVYAYTGHALRSNLEASVKARAAQTDPELCTAFRVDCGGGFVRPGPRPPQARNFPGPGPPGGQSGLSTGRRRFNRSSDVSAVYVDRDLHVRHEDGVVGRAILDPDDLEEVIYRRAPHCCEIESNGGASYLTYIAPLWYQDRVIGAVQTAISTRQYDDTMGTLLRILLGVAVAGLVLSAGISAALVRRAIRPIARSFQRQRDFVADAAHELRTPLAIQRTVGDVGMGDSSTEALQEAVSLMMRENRHLTRLVDDLSLLARSDSNAVSIEHQAVDFSSVVQTTATELAYLAEEQGVTMEIDVHRGIQVTGDVLRLRQMILVLLDNALKFTPPGGTIKVMLARQGRRVQLQVRDSGPGIAPEHLPRIFDRFYRADKARTSEGSGLGLAIARWIVGAHGGTISAANAPTGGALFTVTLPMTSRDALARDTRVQEQPRPS